MGIDIYARWKGQTEAEARAEVCGFDATLGRVGYLREAYHGEPYATQHLVHEAFESPSCQARIPATVLRARLPRTMALAIERERRVYGRVATADDPVVRSFADFVALCEERERATGEPVTIVASY